MSKPEPCVFCAICAKQIDTELTVFENEHVIAQVSLLQKPRNQGHVLVMPRKHLQNIYELSAELNAPLMSALQLLSGAVKKAFSAEGVHIRQNNESAAGQDVFHLHFHVIPRYHEDNFEAEKYEKLSFRVRQEIAERLKESVRREMQTVSAQAK